MSRVYVRRSDAYNPNIIESTYNFMKADDHTTTFEDVFRELSLPAPQARAWVRANYIVEIRLVPRSRVLKRNRRKTGVVDGKVVGIFS